MKWTRYIFVSQLLLVFVCAAKINAQTPAVKSNRNRPDAETKSAQNLMLENFILLAHTAPPEVAADVLLSLVATQPAITNTRKKELIEDAFRFALNRYS